MIHVIVGPPCAGKSTYMREHAANGDVLVDYDAIAQAFGRKEPHSARRGLTDPHIAAFVARRAVVEWAVENAADVESWVIHTNPLPENMDTYRDAGAEIIELDTDMETCLQRAEADGRPPGTDDAIREWFDRHAPKGAFFMPAKGGGMPLKVKHTESKTDLLNTTFSAEGHGSITGYAATFGHEKPDSYGDVIAKGAFAESIERINAEGKAIPLLWNHDSGDLKSYIGTVTRLEEDDHGLLFEASFDGTERAQRARELAADGRLCKFSFAYGIQDQETVTLEDGTEANELRKLDLFEVSLVMYPANPDTSVVEVKGAQEPAEKAGRRNSKKDADALKSVLGKLSEIQSIVNGLLESELSDEQEAEAEADEAKANAEEPRGANAEEPEARGADVDALLEKANKLLTERG